MATSTNSEIFNWSGPMGLPRFDLIDSEDYAAAFEQALKSDRADINAIADNEEAPTYDNTVVALELAGEELSRVGALFWNLSGSHSNDTLRGLEREIAPKLSKHSTETTTNAKLFARLDALWQQRDELGLTTEQTRVLERKWKAFVRGGAALQGAAQTRLGEINARLAQLGAGFSQNILADEADWALIVEEDDLVGLPDFVVSAMKAAGEERGRAGKHAVTLSRSIIEPFLTFSERRDLREQAFAAWIARGERGGETDNRDTVRETVALRQEKANLLGYESFAHFKLEDQMAKRPEAVTDLLETVWDKAKDKAAQEEDELAALIAEAGHNHDVAPWDWRHYAEQLRTRKFAFNESELKPYLALDNIITAAFDVANRLFGITVKEHTGIQAYHEDVRVFEVLNPDGSHRAVFIGDYFARASKRSGAWMSGFQGQHKLTTADGKQGQTPIIVNVMNFAKAPEGQQTLLSMDDARTLFHEFGHALHGILSDVTYPSVSGTSVARDFVELPSQVYEHWLTVPEILSKHARHVETGKAMPQELLDKVLAAQTFNAGFGAVEFTASALVDMEFHKPHAEPVSDVIAFEKATLERLGMPKSITMRHRTPHFAHVFSGDGYSAGYYSYMWSEVLDADAFAAFEEVNDPFDDALAQRLHDHIYSAGGSVDPEETYKTFRGKMPSVDAMIEKRGLL
ncbi:MAG: M3 family metallopeptidase [Rhizobiaceae bacterium]|nr:M3 family metallopeptidase [Hyphomicrobiales bacterium]NRB29539.1 M3 family metallopeptidase [Rhizobiaceae bacterium]